jgi:ABC-type nitrate/sulfonate/bicarbonate transport system permease component
MRYYDQLRSILTRGFSPYPQVFAGLFTVILIGLVVENMIFRQIELRTIRKWGMQL